MTADDLSAPLGRGSRKSRSAAASSFRCLSADHRRQRSRCFSASSCCGRSWATIRSAASRWRSCRSNLHAAMKPQERRISAAAAGAAPPPGSCGPQRRPADGPAVIQARRARPRREYQDRHHHRRQDRRAAGSGDTGAGAGRRQPSGGRRRPAARPEQKFVEMTAHGPLPKIAADGTRPADAFARPVQPLPGKPDAPRVALIVGRSRRQRQRHRRRDRQAAGPGDARLRALWHRCRGVWPRARAAAGTRFCCRCRWSRSTIRTTIPGPQTLLTSLTPQQNIDRLYWLMSRFQGYVGVVECDGSAFHRLRAGVRADPARNRQARADLCRRRLQSAQRRRPASPAPTICRSRKADVILDSVPTPTEIDRALGRLEMAAREHGVAVGIASALPVSIDHIAKWAKAAPKAAACCWFRSPRVA